MTWELGEVLELNIELGKVLEIKINDTRKYN